ncbi:MAG: hypothetical protein IPF84_03190 [Proteobacteria bacterium]|nr:hypothetical protein [Pseudomonadota bacterium]
MQRRLQRTARDARQRLQYQRDDGGLQAVQQRSDPGQRSMRHVDIREREQQQHGRQNEAEARGDATADAVQFPAEEDRQLQRFGTRQQHAEVERPREFAVVEPAATLDDFTVENGNLAGGTAKGNETKLRPEAGSFGEWRWRGAAEEMGRSPSIKGGRPRCSIFRTSRKRQAPRSSCWPRAIR